VPPVSVASRLRPKGLADSCDSTARSGSGRKPPGALYTGSGREGFLHSFRFWLWTGKPLSEAVAHGGAVASGRFPGRQRMQPPNKHSQRLADFYRCDFIFEVVRIERIDPPF